MLPTAPITSKPCRRKRIGTITVGETSRLDSTKFSSTSQCLPFTVLNPHSWLVSVPLPFLLPSFPRFNFSPNAARFWAQTIFPRNVLPVIIN